MALYSVWDWNRNSYRVYSTPTPVSVGDDPIPPKPNGISPIGANPDSDVKPLPPGARFIGYDHLARGEIRRVSNGFGDLGDDAGSGGNFWTQPAVMFSFGVASTFLLAELWRRRRMRSNKKRRARRRRR
jgi:hypothetical protein